MTQQLYKLNILKNLTPSIIDSITIFSSSSRNSGSDLIHSAIFATSSDEVFALGDNGFGQLGVGDIEERKVPEKVLPVCNKKVTFLLMRYLNACAIIQTGELFLWGDNTYGQVGNNSFEMQTTPTKVLGLDGKQVVELDCGLAHFIIKTKTGEVYTWGRNLEGQIGIHGRFAQEIPFHLKFNEKVIQIAAGDYHSLVLTETSLYTFGFNESGQLGNGTTNTTHIPTKVIGIPDKSIVIVSAGSDHSMALDNKGQVWVWGDNSCGQIGNSKIKCSLTPMKVGGELTKHRIVDILCLWEASVAQSTAGVFLWGKLTLKDFYFAPTRTPYKRIDEAIIHLCNRTYRLYKPKEVPTYIDETFVQNIMLELRRGKLFDVCIYFDTKKRKQTFDYILIKKRKTQCF